MSHAHEVLTSSQDPNWGTPQILWDAIRQDYHVCLDVCSDAARAQSMMVDYIGPGSFLLDDALSGVPWIDVVETLLDAVLVLSQTAIFMNPPYCRGDKKKGIPAMPIEPWIKLAAEAGQCVRTIGVLPYATQTEWWRQYVQATDPRLRAMQIRRFHHRISFDPPPGSDKPKANANVNTAVVIWSPETNAWVEPWQPHEIYWDIRGRR